MNWFQHESDASENPKHQRLISRYGMEGFGVYWFVVGKIAKHYEEHGDALHRDIDIELLSHLSRVDEDRLLPMIEWMIERDLFQEHEISLLRCIGINTRLSETLARRKREERAKKLKESGATPAKNGEKPDLSVVTPARGEERRVDKRRGENTQSAAAPARVSDDIPESVVEIALKTWQMYKANANTRLSRHTLMLPTWVPPIESLLRDYDEQQILDAVEFAFTTDDKLISGWKTAQNPMATIERNFDKVLEAAEADRLESMSLEERMRLKYDVKEQA